MDPMDIFHSMHPQEQAQLGEQIDRAWDRPEFETLGNYNFYHEIAKHLRTTHGHGDWLQGDQCIAIYDIWLLKQDRIQEQQQRNKYRNHFRTLSTEEIAMDVARRSSTVASINTEAMEQVVSLREEAVAFEQLGITMMGAVLRKRGKTKMSDFIEQTYIAGEITHRHKRAISNISRSMDLIECSRRKVVASKAVEMVMMASVLRERGQTEMADVIEQTCAGLVVSPEATSNPPPPVSTHEDFETNMNATPMDGAQGTNLFGSPTYRTNEDILFGVADCCTIVSSINTKAIHVTATGLEGISRGLEATSRGMNRYENHRKECNAIEALMMMKMAAVLRERGETQIADEIDEVCTGLLSTGEATDNPEQDLAFSQQPKPFSPSCFEGKVPTKFGDTTTYDSTFDLPLVHVFVEQRVREFVDVAANGLCGWLALVARGSTRDDSGRALTDTELRGYLVEYMNGNKSAYTMMKDYWKKHNESYVELSEIDIMGKYGYLIAKIAGQTKDSWIGKEELLLYSHATRHPVKVLRDAPEGFIFDMDTKAVLNDIYHRVPESHPSERWIYWVDTTHYLYFHRGGKPVNPQYSDYNHYAALVVAAVQDTEDPVYLGGGQWRNPPRVPF